MLQAYEPFKGIWQIRDAMGVCMTLIKRGSRALLVDTGYGLEDPGAFVRRLAGCESEVLLTHGHHDHVLGARYFAGLSMFEEEREEYLLRTARTQRERVAEQARAKGVSVPDDYLTFEAPEPKLLRGGGFLWEDVEILRVQGHTYGSAMLYIPEYELLLTGDNWNPCTWLWFPSSVGVREWRANMAGVLGRLKVRSVLCPHVYELQDAALLRAYLDGVTDAAIESAERTDMGSPIDTRVLHPTADTVLVFDYAKAGLLHIYRSLNQAGKDMLINTARGFAGNPDMQKEGSSGAAAI